MLTQSERSKRKLIASFGGACQWCGYCKSIRALHFHHQDSSEKRDWNGGTGRASPAEVRAHPERFLLLCANCHIEEHERIDETSAFKIACPVCGTEFQTIQARLNDGRGKFCSQKCARLTQFRNAVGDEAIAQRFWRYVHKTESCWIWNGARNGDYGNLMVTYRDGRHSPRLSHHIAYEVQVGPIPNGKPHWACGNKLCMRCDAQHFSIY